MVEKLIHIGYEKNVYNCFAENKKIRLISHLSLAPLYRYIIAWEIWRNTIIGHSIASDPMSLIFHDDKYGLW